MSADSSNKAQGPASSRASAQSPGQTQQKSVEPSPDDAGEAVDRGRFNSHDSARAARDVLAEDLARLRADMSKLQETLAALVSGTGERASRTMDGVGRSLAEEVGAMANSIADAGAEIADSAKDQAKTFAAELEATARKNPLGTLATALLAGIVIGMMTRGRN